MLQNIPFELQQLDQWVVATGALLPDGKRDKTPLNPRTGYKADVCDRSTWGSFEEAQKCGYPFVGFVLSKDDPYCIIDLDDPSTSPEAEAIAARHQKILGAFQSYSELSQSGLGVHIITRGSLPHGVRRDKVEIYSDARYMICTGNVYNPLPIADCQELLTGMFHQMNAEQPSVGLVQMQGTLTDDELYHMAAGAANADKFAKLWAGEWAGQPEWPSQSEADFALLSMLGFYSKDNEQVRRLFRWSALGKRDKAVRNNTYIDTALKKIRAKEAPPIDFSQLLTKHEQLELPVVPSSDAGAPTEANGPSPRPVAETARDACEFPPGFIGELAQYILDSSIRPVPEISLVTAIALTAGVCGRTYNISGYGLNQYLVLLARTGSGKEGAQNGIDRMVSAVRSQIPMVDQFIGPASFASGQALVRAFDKQTCFVSVLGEFGYTLQNLCDPNQNEATRRLKQALLDIYSKSGFNSVLRPNVYSDSLKDTKLVQAPNLTFLGESTPETFYDGLDANAIAQGLIPRFSIFEYDGPRPPKNPHAFAPPPSALVDKFATLLQTAISSEQRRAHCPVMIDSAAQAMLDEFDRTCDEQMNGALFDVNRQLWNRAHLKALKLAALIAVGINPHGPCVTVEAAKWAILAVERDIRKLVTHFGSGDVGQGDERMEADLKRAVNDYLKMKPAARREYQVPDSIVEMPIVPVGYLKRRLRPLSAFRNHRLGSNAALDLVLKSMCGSGELQLVPPAQALLQFKMTSPAYVLGVHWR